MSFSFVYLAYNVAHICLTSSQGHRQKLGVQLTGSRAGYSKHSSWAVRHTREPWALDLPNQLTNKYDFINYSILSLKGNFKLYLIFI